MTQARQIAADTPALANEATDSRRGWLAVGSSFVALGVTFGVTYSFGAFVTSFKQAFAVDSGAIGAAFSIASFVFLMLGAVTGPLCDRFGPRYLVLASGCLIGGALVATSFLTKFGWIYLTYGVGVGLGVGCVFVPVVSNVGAWFTRQRATALGIAVSGVGIGTLCGPPIAALTIRTHGWRTAAAMMGLVAAASLISIAFFIPAAPSAPSGAGARSESIWSFFRTRVFVLLYGAGICSGLAVYVPIVFLPAYAESIGVAAVRSATLVSVVGISSVLSRLLFGALGDRVGILGSYKLANLLVALSYAAWLLAHSYAGLVVAATVLGVGYGGAVALTPAVMALYFGRDRLGGAMGAGYTGTSIGALFGAPLAGAMVSAGRGYGLAIVSFMGIGLFGAALLFALRNPQR